MLFIGDLEKLAQARYNNAAPAPAETILPVLLTLITVELS
jgi:hypothetical protein